MSILCKRKLHKKEGEKMIGWTYEEVLEFRDLLIKSNTEQLIAASSAIQTELFSRVQKTAQVLRKEEPEAKELYLVPNQAYT